MSGGNGARRRPNERTDQLNLPMCPRCGEFVPAFLTICPECSCGIYRVNYRHRRKVAGLARPRGLGSAK